MKRFAVLVVVTLVLGVLGLPGVGVGGVFSVPASAQPTEGLCDSEGTDQFWDVGDSDYGAAYILCMRALGLSQGSKDGSYRAGRALSRGQMASLLARLWTEQLDRECPSDVDVPFTDIQGNTHEANIKCLFALGITNGKFPTEYRPQETLTDWQIALFLYRVYQKAGGDQCVGADGSELERARKCLVSLRVIPEEDEVRRSIDLTRAQMGVYVVGLWHNLTGRGLPPVPPLRASKSMTSNVNAVRLIAISAGWWHSCGLRMDGIAVCWGNNYKGVWKGAVNDVPSGKFSAISAGNLYSCGLRTDGRVVCWGENRSGKADPPPDVKFSAISTGAAGSHHSCGLRVDGRVACWGDNSYGQSDVPGGEFVSVSAGGGHSCGLREGGTVVCWGRNLYGQSDVPGGEFVSVSAGGDHSCGLRVDGRVVCWGHNSFGKVDDAPGGEFVSVSASGSYSCGLRTDGTVVCWGSKEYGKTDAPGGEFSVISAGGNHVCGLRTDGTAVCWGRNEHGQVDMIDISHGAK